MAYKVQASFSAGVLDPALRERTNLDKYQSGLSTLKNALIGKTGRIISRPGTIKDFATKSPTLVSGTFTAATTDICTKANHGLVTGDKVRVSTTNTLPAGLSAGTDYWVIFRTVSTFYLATSLANAIAENHIDITSTGTGTHTITPQSPNKKCILYSPTFTSYLIEWGHGYVRVHNTDDGTYDEAFHYYSEDDLDLMQFTPSGTEIFISCKGKVYTILDLVTGAFSLNRPYLIPAAVSATSSVITGTGYRVDYAFSGVYNGQEGDFELNTSASFLLPISAGEKNTFTISTAAFPTATEVRAYRRPFNGIAFGFMASVPVSGGSATVIDYGEDVDYTHQPPTVINPDYAGISAATPATSPRSITYYQQRLLLVNQDDEQVIDASRPGFIRDFYRDYPYNANSALSFKCGSTGNAKVMRFLDNGGLIAFTTVGVYQNTGPLTPDNIVMDKKANYVIEEKVPPLEVPGAILFVDKLTNTVRTLNYSTEGSIYEGNEISIFSNHLFTGKKVKSWAFQDGNIPVVWVVMDDGTLNGLTYQKEHQMQAWSYHETDGLFESVAVVKSLDAESTAYFVVNRDGVRTVEYLSPREFTDIKAYVGMDATVTFNSELTEDGAIVDVTLVTADDYEGELILTSDTAIFVNTAGNGAVGTIFKFFDSDGSGIELEVTAYTSTTSVTVQPSAEFPQNEMEAIRLYKTYTLLSGLDHLEGKKVSVLSDGYVVSSPNNDNENYDEHIVSGGQLTVSRGAFVHVGLPFTSDIETLELSTVEQKPTLLESRLVNRVYLSVYKSRGLYIGSNYPTGEVSVSEMMDPETITEDPDFEIIGNAALEPVTKRYDIVIPNDWNVGGKIAIRQVDPLPFEILSIIPDLMVLS